ncbi:MAG TPA: hypothetical protein VFD60_07525 [Nitrososphaeraceae archaeon]|nr:hypothetical protein [Nitrososphaeraceae archaeon]
MPTFYSDLTKLVQMYGYDPMDLATHKIETSIKDLKEGLDPEIIAYWYKRVEDRAIETVPSHLKDKIHFEQNRLLWMKFKLNVSRRAVPFIMQVIEDYIPLMPYTTGLYFRKIQNILTEEMDKELR